ncbi:UNVERIFIED_CONTAM: hypothetical protein H355_004031 [Colinus virginianus]|nr:hypothetical protein H355_004031 [Colinus virginianus]
MFEGRRAWFSRSVPSGPQQLWVAGGGLLARWQDAEYLFSSDATHPDTRSIHESLEYLDGRATVFHSCYLSAWANSSAAKQQPMALGHFVLPPACLQEGIACARDMRKYSGELRDFTPGTAGYAAYCVRSEVSLCSDAKTRKKTL